MIIALENASQAIALYIHDCLLNDHPFKWRSYYAESFSLNLLSMSGLLEKKCKEKLLIRYERMDKTDPEFHWEFNNYALLCYVRTTNDLSVGKYLTPLHFKNTPCTNWTLLRSNARLLAGAETDRAIKEAKRKIRGYQLRSGLILDDPGVRSFQYHCFSLAMIAEIYGETGDTYFLDSFVRGLNFIRQFVLSNGDTLYVGRGQEQSFGYAALIYALSLGMKYLEDKSINADLRVVSEFVLSFQRKDGSFPLVMNDAAPKTVHEEISRNRNLPGWYPYNNYYDYLAFMGYFLAKSLVVLASVPLQSSIRKNVMLYQDSDFKKMSTFTYEAVVARAGGYWTNDLAMPYLVSRNHSLMPCYGGEQFAESIYGVEGLPMPFNYYFNISMRTKRLFVSLLFGKKMVAVSMFGIMIRSFEFDENGITITTRIWSYLKMCHTYLFKHSISQIGDKRLEDDYLVVSSDRSMEYDSLQYSASGPLKRFRVSGRKHSIGIHLK